MKKITRACLAAEMINKSFHFPHRVDFTFSSFLCFSSMNKKKKNLKLQLARLQLQKIASFQEHESYYITIPYLILGLFFENSL